MCSVFWLLNTPTKNLFSLSSLLYILFVKNVFEQCTEVGENDNYIVFLENWEYLNDNGFCKEFKVY